MHRMRDYSDFELTPDFFNTPLVHPAHETITVKLAEMTMREFEAPNTYIPELSYANPSLTNLNAIVSTETEMHGTQAIYLDVGNEDNLSEAARVYNATLARDVVTDYLGYAEKRKVALMARRPSEEQKHYAANKTEMDLAFSQQRRDRLNLYAGLNNLFTLMATAYPVGVDKAIHKRQVQQATHPHHFEQGHHRVATTSTS